MLEYMMIFLERGAKKKMISAFIDSSLHVNLMQGEMRIQNFDIS